MCMWRASFGVHVSNNVILHFECVIPFLIYWQISYSQPNAWSTYSPGYGSSMHPLHHLVGSQMYRHFPSGNFNGISQAYCSHTEGVLVDNVFFSQVGHIPVGHTNMEWMNGRTMAR